MTGVWEESERALRAQRGALCDQIAKAINALPAKTARTMARATYKVLWDAAKAEGQEASREVMIRKPGEPRHFSDDRCWCVAWEAGPYDWAIPASMAIVSQCGKLAEPYYGFDLCFYPGEDA
jgi:hypothetical protein